MSYVVFDLDCTLVNLTAPVWNSLCIMQPESTAKWKKQLTIVQTGQNYKWESALAYDSFVKGVAKAEMSSKPLGILRPGIVQVILEVAKKRQNGTVKGVIMYTNNSNEALVNFSRDVLQYCAKAKIFDDCIYVHHPLRAKRAKYPDMVKTWAVLKDLLVESVHAPTTISPNEVLFYDDQPHRDLMSALGTNYIRVTPYEYEPKKTRLVELILDSFNKTKLLEPELFEEFRATVGACYPSFLTTTREAAPTHLRTLITGNPQPALYPEQPHEDKSAIDTMLNSLKRRNLTHANSNINLLANFWIPKKTIRRSKTKRSRTKRSKY